MNFPALASSSNGTFDLNLLTRQLIAAQITPDQYTEQLSAQTDHDESQEKLYQILKNGFLAVPKDEERAISVLRNAIKAQRSWALWIKANEIREGKKPTSFDYILANRGHQEAQSIVNSTPIFFDAMAIIDSVKKCAPKKIKRTFNLSVLGNKWSHSHLGFPLYSLSVVLEKKGMIEDSRNLLEKSLDLGCICAALEIVQLASKYLSDDNRMLQSKAYEYYQKLLPIAIYTSDSVFVDDIRSSLGMMNYQGYANTPPDRAKAHSFFQLVKNPSLHVYNKLASIYRDGFEGMPQDEEKAMDYFRKAVQGGHIPSMTSLALLLKRTSQEEARELTLAAAEGNDLGAMHILAGWYREEGVMEKSEYWELKAAESGHPFSMNNVAADCVAKQQFEAAYEWVQRSLLVKGSNTTTFPDGSMISIDNCCSKGWRNRIRGQSYNILGYMHEIGVGGLEKNEQLALSYYVQSASLNHDYGQYNAGRILLEQEEQYKRALKYFVQAAHLGNTNAMMSLVNVYLSSQVDQDREKGMFWLQRARALGDEIAKEYLENPEIEDSKIEELIESSNQPVEPVLNLNAENDNDEEMFEIVESGPSSSNKLVFDLEEEIFPTYTPIIRNPKYIRENLRRLNVERQMEIEQRQLAPRSQLIAQRILSQEYVSHNELRRFFEDSAFERHNIRLSLTKNGLKIEATNKVTGVRVSISTHKVHGANKPEAFRADLRKLLQTVFPWAGN